MEIQRVVACPLSDENIFSDRSAILEAKNRFYFGDNLDVLNFISNTDETSNIKLIYIDPPYMSQVKYQSRIEYSNVQYSIDAFEDRWGNNIERYLEMLYPRLLLMRKVLHPNGSIMVHVDWHVSHYVRVLLDEIFGRENFINEIIWCYGGGGNTRKSLQRKHDTIFWYACSSEYTFNPQYRPYTPGTLERGLTAVKGSRYKLSDKGAILQDWWTDINKILSPTAYENVKYPTQKPKKLLERLIYLASNPGDIVADFFSGSATTAEVCNQMNRSWILCDNSSLSLQTSMSRLIKTDSLPFSIYASDKSAVKTIPIGVEYLTGEQNHKLLIKPVFKENGPDKYWLSLGIDFYQPETLSDNWNIQQFANFIDFWEIDPEYNGEVFCSQYQILRQNNKIKNPAATTAVISVPKKKSYTIGIKIYDIFNGQITAKFSFDAD